MYEWGCYEHPHSLISIPVIVSSIEVVENVKFSVAYRMWADTSWYYRFLLSAFTFEVSFLSLNKTRIQLRFLNNRTTRDSYNTHITITNNHYSCHTQTHTNKHTKTLSEKHIKCSKPHVSLSQFYFRPGKHERMNLFTPWSIYTRVWS